VIPVGRGVQDLMVVEKRPGGALHTEQLLSVRFVPMTGAVERAAP
jgi:protein-L-isoaspartate O-methyltransferase